MALFFAIACTNLQWVATAGAAGASSLSIWLIGAAAMFVPISLVVMNLSRRFPQEGGMYVWSNRAFGPLAGFMTGWTYWCSNLPYFSALLYFMAGNALFISGGGAGRLSGSPAYYLTVSLAAFAIATVLNLAGMDIGKWLNNVGAYTRLAVTAILIALGVLLLVRHQSATPLTIQTMRPSLALKDVIFWSVIAFAWTGPEAIPFMAGEIEKPRVTIPRGLALAVPAIAGIYILGTASVLAAVPAGKISGLYGVMQGIGQTAAQLHLPLITAVAAALVAISCMGSVGAWLGIAARIPFVAGIDRYLPPSFAYVHPRWRSPAVAILWQAGISVIFILLGQGGTSVKGAYDVLVSATILITMVPFLLLFASAIKLRSGIGVIAASCVGFFTTSAAIVLSVIPAPDEPNKSLAIAKVLFLTAVTLLVGVGFYCAGRRRQQPAAKPVSLED